MDIITEIKKIPEKDRTLSEKIYLANYERGLKSNVTSEEIDKHLAKKNNMMPIKKRKKKGIKTL
jgi:hypothetical protein